MLSRLLASLPLVAALAAGTPLRAAPPLVVADIPPVAGLVAAVMEGVGAPELLLSGSGSPHGGALRPSEARSLQQADLVVWIGPGMTPWLGKAIGALAGETPRLTLLEAPETHVLPARDAEEFGGAAAHDHDHDHDHEKDAEIHAASALDSLDPHAWLDPRNAAAWLAPIAEALSRVDPEHAALYDANAAAAAKRVAAAAATAQEMLAPARSAPFMVGHDAFQYFESAFGLTAAGAITLSDNAKPGPAHVAQLRAAAEAAAPVCVFLEPGENDALFATVFEGQIVRQVELDPLGWSIAPGPKHYTKLLRDLAARAADCLS